MVPVVVVLVSLQLMGSLAGFLKKLISCSSVGKKPAEIVLGENALLCGYSKVCELTLVLTTFPLTSLAVHLAFPCMMLEQLVHLCAFWYVIHQSGRRVLEGKRM